jgi:predicted MFS family arabinose efflux permease
MSPIFVPIAGSSIGFFLPLAVVPLFAQEHGSSASAGLATGAFLLATVLFELVTPRIVGFCGYRWTLAGGLLLLGAPTLVFLEFSSAPVLVAVGIVRGAGFAVAIVAGGALAAALIPADRRGRGLAATGVVSGVSSLAAMPLGMWMAGTWGFGPVFVLTAAAPLVAMVAVPFLPRVDVPRATQRRSSIPGWPLLRPAVLFTVCTSAAGVLVTFLPMALDRRLAWVAPVALFVQPAVATAARWIAGRLGDRRGQASLLVPGVVLSVAGMAALAATGSAAIVLLGAASFGAGFGILQNATLAMMYARAPLSAYSDVSALWNAAYDLGMALGAIGVGVLVSSAGFSAAFLLTAAGMLPALVLARREAAQPAPSAEPAPAAACA